MSDDTDTPDDGTPDPFEGLAEQATALEGAGQADAQARAQAAAADTIAATSDELFEALTVVRSMAAPTVAWWQEFGAVWSDKALHGIADAGAAVMQKHGWTMGQAWASLGPYIALAAATLPPSLVTWQAIKAHKEQQARQAQQAPRRQGQAPQAGNAP